MTYIPEWLVIANDVRTRMYVQLRLVCSAGVSPVRVKAGNSVA